MGKNVERDDIRMFFFCRINMPQQLESSQGTVGAETRADKHGAKES